MSNPGFRAESRGSSRWRGGRGFGHRNGGKRTEARGGRASWRGGSDGGGYHRQVESLKTAPVGELLSTISLFKVQSSPRFKDVVPIIKNCEYISSYNWLNNEKPTILVPGMPPVWTPPIAVPKLHQDSGDYFRDPNAARWPQFPMEPAVRAVFTFNPDFEATNTQVVTCGSTMGNLLRFATSSERSFEFNIEVIGNTVFLVRMGNSPKELIPDVRGYGHTFPEAYTSWDKSLQGSVSHQRIVKYQFGEISCLLRFECDGYLKEKAVSESNQTKAQASSSEKSDISYLLRKTRSVFVSENSASKGNDLTIELSGQQIPQSAIFDLKTRSVHKKIDMEELYPRLWVSQIPNFIIAYHNSGVFDDIQNRNILSELRAWETNNDQQLRILHETLHQLISIVKQVRGHTVGVRRTEGGPLEIRKLTQNSWSALPHDLKAKWTGVVNTQDRSEASPLSPETEPGDDSFEDEETQGGDDYLNF